MARCAKRLIPGVPVTVTVAGTFSPSVIKGRVARCEVGGIGKDGTIQYKIGVAFDEPVSLPDDDRAPVEEPAAFAETLQPPIENRW